MSIVNLLRTSGVMSDHRSRECGLCGLVLARVIVASFFPFSFFTGNVMAAAGSENFEGPYADRTFRIINYTNGTIRESLRFPSFDPLLGNGSAHGIQFNEQYIPNKNRTSDFAQIRPDPLNASNHVLWLRGISVNGSKVRNELHFSTPYGNRNQPNGTKYTFAFRFYTPIAMTRMVIMQGYSQYPFLRVDTLGKGELRLVLVLCGKTQTVCNAGMSKSPQDYSVLSTRSVELGSYKVGSWNTVVLNVLHDNRESSGSINAYLNGVKKTYSGRTTYHIGDTLIPWLKAGPYGPKKTVELYYDDVHWLPGFVNP